MKIEVYMYRTDNASLHFEKCPDLRRATYPVCKVLAKLDVSRSLYDNLGPQRCGRCQNNLNDALAISLRRQAR